MEWLGHPIYQFSVYIYIYILNLVLIHIYTPIYQWSIYQIYIYINFSFDSYMYVHTYINGLKICTYRWKVLRQRRDSTTARLARANSYLSSFRPKA